MYSQRPKTERSVFRQCWNPNDRSFGSMLFGFRTFGPEISCSVFERSDFRQLVLFGPNCLKSERSDFRQLGPKSTNCLKSERSNTEQLISGPNVRNPNNIEPNDRSFGFQHCLKTERSVFGRWLYIFSIKINRFWYKFDLLIDLNRSNVNYSIENGRFISKIVWLNQKLVKFDRKRWFISKTTTKIDNLAQIWPISNINWPFSNYFWYKSIYINPKSNRRDDFDGF